MSRGGARSGAGRKSNALTAAVQATGETDMALALAAVIDNETVDLATRLDACRHLAGASVARVISEFKWAA